MPDFLHLLAGAGFVVLIVVVGLLLVLLVSWALVSLVELIGRPFNRRRNVVPALDPATAIADRRVAGSPQVPTSGTTRSTSAPPPGGANGPLLG